MGRRGRPTEMPLGCVVPYNWLFEMFCIKFVPTSEMRVQFRTEEYAERTWERGTAAPLVPITNYALLIKMPHIIYRRELIA